MLSRLGVDRIVRIIAATMLLGAWALTIVQIRPDLSRPTDLLSDTSNYLAAGERVRDGHFLYRLTAGDRPAPADNPPYWSTPLLSPPLVAVIWAPLASMPGGFAEYAWWTAGMAGTTLFGLLAIARGKTWVAIGVALLSYLLGVTAWSGNLNAFLVPLIGLIWPLTRENHPRARGDYLAGALVALMSGLKLTPVFLGVWFVATGNRRALVAAAITGIILLGFSVALAGTQAYADYLQIGGATATVGGGGLSLVGLLAGAGVSGRIAALSPALVAVVAGALALAVRSRPGLAFFVTTLAVIFASPVVRFESLALVVSAFSPWLRWSSRTMPNEHPGHPG